MTERELCRARCAHGQTRVVSDALARPDGESRAALQVEEGDSAVFELLAHDSFGLEPQSVAVKAKGSLQIVDADGKDGNSRFHPAFLRWLRGESCSSSHGKCHARSLPWILRAARTSARGR